MGKKFESSRNLSKTKQKKLNKGTEVGADSTKISTIAIDTGAFIDLVRIDPDYLPSKKEAGYKDELRKVKRIVLNGRLRLVITPTILQEILEKADSRELDFLCEHCWYSSDLENSKIKLVNKSRARLYLKKDYVRNKPDNKSYNDACALAEASQLGLCFLTVNTYDLIDYGKTEAKGTGKGGRVVALEQLNEELGLVDENLTAPHPVTPKMFLDSYKIGVYVSDIKLESITEELLKKIPLNN